MKLYNWCEAAEITASELAEGKLTEISAGDKKVGLLKKGESIFAFAAACPHAGIPLCTGWLDALGNIVCPQHKYRFNPENGRNVSGEGYKLFNYPVQVLGEKILIGFLKAD